MTANSVISDDMSVSSAPQFATRKPNLGWQPAANTGHAQSMPGTEIRKPVQAPWQPPSQISTAFASSRHDDGDVDNLELVGQLCMQ